MGTQGAHPHVDVVACLPLVLKPLAAHPVVAVRRRRACLELNAVNHRLPIKQVVPENFKSHPNRHHCSSPSHRPQRSCAA